MTRLRRLLRTTAVRLTIIYTVLFGVLAVGVVAYVSFSTGRLLIQQFQATIGEEVEEIARITRRGGIRRLIRIIERRSRWPGGNLYLVADSGGRIIAGNVRDMDRSLLVDDGWLIPPFQYRRFDEEAGESFRAVARVFTLPGELKLLVGRDLGETQQFTTIVRRAVVTAVIVMALIALVVWFLVGRRALQHIDRVAQTSERIVAGDLSQRLPLAGSGDEFDRLSGSLNQLIARIEKLNSGVREMSDSIAHDLKTPLTRLRNSAEAALDAEEGEARGEAVQRIIEDADGIIRTFDALLMISQVEAGARSVELSELELGDVVREAHEFFEPLAEDVGAKLDLAIEQEAAVSGHRALLFQALSNLLENATKYGATADNPRIAIALRMQGQSALIRVEDNGPGIPDEEVERVRERFVRLERSRTKPGHGLGLSLVDAVVKLHNGTLTLRDAGPGLRATLELPLLRNEPTVEHG